MNELFSILRGCVNSVIDGIIVLAIGFVVFSLMERLFSLSPSKKPWRATLLDLQYAFLSMLYPPVLNFIISGVFAFIALDPGRTLQNSHASWFLFAPQLLFILFVRDLLIYLRHRMFHLRAIWAFHSIHHSSEELDWISALRFHPGENMIEVTLELVVFGFCAFIGVDPLVLSVAGLVTGFYNLFIHSNLRWTFGPLRYVLVSPVFHRWHHSDATEATDKNFAAMFSCIDLAFGTFYMPGNSSPQTLGLSEQEKSLHPRSLAGQLLYPFRKR